MSRLRLLFLFCFLPALLRADGSGAEFLLLDMDAKVTAMGGAAVARRADLSGMRANPATIVGLSSPRASFTHLSAFSEWDHDWLAVAMPFGANALGLELLSSRLRPFTYYDDLGNEVGTLNAGSLEAAVAYGRAVRSVALGVTGRVFRGQLADYSNWGYSGDLGANGSPSNGPAWARPCSTSAPRPPTSPWSTRCPRFGASAYRLSASPPKRWGSTPAPST